MGNKGVKNESNERTSEENIILKKEEFNNLKKQINELRSNLELLREENVVLKMTSLADEPQTNKRPNKKMAMEKRDNIKFIRKTWKKKDYEYLVFSGGGIKAISFCSALDVLDRHGILYDTAQKLKIKGIAGTSAGSIVAALLAVGYTPKEIIEILKTMEFDKLFCDNASYLRDGYNFLKNYGFCIGEYLTEWMGELIKNKTGDENYTIENLYQDKGIKLVIVTTNLNSRTTIYINPQNEKKEYRAISIKDAVRMSVGIPLQFSPKIYNGDYMVDGGVLDNYALHVFDGAYPGDPSARLNLGKINPKVLGIKIITAKDFGFYQNIDNRCEIGGLIDYGLSFIDLFLLNNEKEIMTPNNWLRTIVIITPDYPLTKSSLTQQEKEELIECGIKYCNKFLDEEHNQSMKNIKKNVEKILDPSLQLDSTKSLSENTIEKN